MLTVLLVLIPAGHPFGVGDRGDQGGGAVAQPSLEPTRLERGILIGLIFGAVCGVTALLAAGHANDVRIKAAIIAGGTVALAVGLVSLLLPIKQKAQPPSYTGLLLQGRVRLFARRLAGGVGYGLTLGGTCGLLSGIILGLTLISFSGNSSSLLLGLIAGIGLGLLWGFAEVTITGVGEEKFLVGIAHVIRPRQEQTPLSYTGMPLGSRVRLFTRRLAGGLTYGLTLGFAILLVPAVILGLIIVVLFGTRSLIAVAFLLVLLFVSGLIWGWINGVQAGLGEGLRQGLRRALRPPDRKAAPTCVSPTPICGLRAVSSH